MNFFYSNYPDTEPLSDKHLQLSHLYYESLEKHADRILLVDSVSGRQWTGAQIKDKAVNIALALVKEHQLRPGDICGILYYQCDWAIIYSIAIIFAGGAISANYYGDPYTEYGHPYNCVNPNFIFSSSSKHKELLTLRQDINTNINFKIVWLDNEAKLNVTDLDPNERPIAQTEDLINYSDKTTRVVDQQQAKRCIPVECDPNLPAYILYTSGSTGLPKPIPRTRKNSAYVSVSLRTAESLWKLNHETVLAGQLALDHGTGIFALKQTIVNGCKLILMDLYDQETMLKNIQKYCITDLMLGSALLHNLMEDREQVSRYDITSLTDIIAIGGKITSVEVAARFMDEHPHCAVRQAYGMTEAGFVSIVPRQNCRDAISSAGQLLPNVRVRLIDRESQQDIKEPQRLGELFIYSPTVSPGYCGNATGLSKRVFMPDGGYKTDDMAYVSKQGYLHIEGRYSEVLCLDDGWKVSPQEIETVIMNHPWVAEVAVIGIPNVALPGCHAPKAFLVLKDGHPIDLHEKDIIQFVADRVSLPKQLHGGARILKEFPRISIGKINRKMLHHLP